MAVGAFAAGYVVDLAAPTACGRLRHRRRGLPLSGALLVLPAWRAGAPAGRPPTSSPLVPGRDRRPVSPREALRADLGHARPCAGPRWSPSTLALGFYAQFESGLPAYALTVLARRRDRPSAWPPPSTASSSSPCRCSSCGSPAQPQRRRPCSWGSALIWTLSWLVLAAASLAPELAAVLFVTTFGIFAVGETMYAPVLNPLTAEPRPVGPRRHDAGHVHRAADRVLRRGPARRRRHPRRRAWAACSSACTSRSACWPCSAPGACARRSRRRPPRPAPVEARSSSPDRRRAALGLGTPVPAPGAAARRAAAAPRSIATVSGTGGWSRGWTALGQGPRHRPRDRQHPHLRARPRRRPRRAVGRRGRGRHRPARWPPAPGPRRCSAAPPATSAPCARCADGVISDADVTERMLRYFVDQVRPSRLVRPRMVVCVPSEVTGVERRALEDAAVRAGARRVYVIEEPMAAAIGAGPAGQRHRRLDGRRHRRRHDRRRRDQPRRHRHARGPCGSAATRSTRRSSPTSRASTRCCWASAAPRTSRSRPARPSRSARS